MKNYSVRAIFIFICSLFLSCMQETETISFFDKYGHIAEINSVSFSKYHQLSNDTYIISNADEDFEVYFSIKNPSKMDLAVSAVFDDNTSITENDYELTYDSTNERIILKYLSSFLKSINSETSFQDISPTIILKNKKSDTTSNTMVSVQDIYTVKLKYKNPIKAKLYEITSNAITNSDSTDKTLTQNDDGLFEYILKAPSNASDAYIYYSIKDSSGNIIELVNDESPNLSTGDVSILLPSGTYEINAIAYKEDFYESNKFIETIVLTTTKYFVQSTGDDTTGNGTKVKPFKTVQKAVDKFISINDGSSNYKVLIIDDLKATSSDINSTDGAFITIGDSTINETTSSTLSSTFNIEITSADENQKTIDANKLGRVFRIKGDYPKVTLRKLKIINGEISDSGSGICLSSTNGLTIEDGTELNNNHTTQNGGAIYAESNLILKTGVVIKNNTADGNGGGLFVTIKGVIDIESISISQNKAGGFGGGIYFKGILRLKDSPKILDNEKSNIFMQDNQFVDVTNIKGGIIGITKTNAPTATDTVKIASTADGVTISDSILFSDNDNYKIVEKTISGNVEYHLALESTLSKLYTDPTIVGTKPQQSNTYELSSEDDLIYVNTLLKKGESLENVTLELINDIKLTKEWIPGQNAFKGTLDGKEHTISDLKINTTNTNSGLFSQIIGGTVKDLKFDNVDITSTNGYLGTICGVMNEGTIDNCEVSVNQVISNSIGFTGGVCGNFSNGIISNTNVKGSGSIKGTTFVGGIAGHCEGIIINCSNSVKLEADTTHAGGITGNLVNNGKIINCVNTADITISANGFIGGIAAFSLSPIFNSCSTGALIRTSTTAVLPTIQGQNNADLTNNAGIITTTITSSPSSIYNCYGVKSDYFNSVSNLATYSSMNKDGNQYGSSMMSSLKDIDSSPITIYDVSGNSTSTTYIGTTVVDALNIWVITNVEYKSESTTIPYKKWKLDTTPTFEN